MRRFLALCITALAFAIPTVAQATPNEDGLRYQFQTWGSWVNNGPPLYRQCVSWQAASPTIGSVTSSWPGWCDDSFPRVNVKVARPDLWDTDWTRPIAVEMERRFANVPFPSPVTSFAPGAGTDHPAVFINHTGQGWQYQEFWVMRQDVPDFPGWSAKWGTGAMFSEMPDVGGVRQAPRVNVGNLVVYTGVRGSGLTYVPGLIELGDFKRGYANHPLAFVVRSSCSTYKYPATRTDGSATSNCVQYGAKFKLDPAVDVNSFTSDSRWCAPSGSRTSEEAAALGWNPATLRCQLPPAAKLVLRTAQSSYLIAADQGGGAGVTFDTESWNRPRTGQWRNEPAGNVYSPYYGCDGRNGTGQWVSTMGGYTWNTSQGVPVGGDAGPDGINGTSDDRWIANDWEQDCAPSLSAAWRGFPYQQLYENVTP
jgi:hypothetical protein